MRGELEKAAPLIGVAIIVDMLDGRVARMTGTTTAFGSSSTRLPTSSRFGVAPAILAFQWGSSRSGASDGGRLRVRRRGRRFASRASISSRDGR